MSAPFSYLPILDHDNLIRINNSRKPMRNQHNSLLSTLNKLLKGFLYLSFRFSIKGRSSLVQKQNFGLADQSSGNSNPLLLAPGQFDPSFTDHGIEPIREVVFVVYEIVSVCSSASLQEVFFRVIGFLETINNVLSDSTGEQNRLLGHNGYLLMVPLGFQVLNIHVIIANLTVSRVVKPLNHGNNGRLATA